MANHLNPSSQILSLFEEVRLQDDDEKIQALDKVIEEIDNLTPTDPCLRCRNAEWILAWNRVERCWFSPRLMSCRAYLRLPEAEDRFGLERPGEFHCTSENSAGHDVNQSVSKDEIHSNRSRAPLLKNAEVSVASYLARLRGQAPRA